MQENNQRKTVFNRQLLERMGALHFGDDVVLFERYAFRYHEARIIRFPYAMIAFIDHGTADISVDEKTFHLINSDQLILLPEQEVSVEHLSEDFHARFVLLSHEFMTYITTDDSYQFIQIVRNNPFVHLEKQVSNTFCSCYDLLKTTILQHDNPYQKQMLHHIIKTYIYGVIYSVQPSIPTIRSREEELTYQFMELVDRHYKEQHSLSFYAEQMHLSSKYISKCVRLTTGLNGAQTIANRLMQQAKAMLLVRQNSISQIGYELGFSDQSTFGKFFRAHENISPQKWRSKQ